MFLQLARLCLAATLIAAPAFGSIPPYIKVCKRTDPNINACITNTIELLRPKLSEGIPELGAPAIEPLNLEQIRLLRGPTGARLDINVTGLQVFGPSSFKVRDLKANVDDVKFTFRVSFGKLHFKGKYSIDARLLLLRLQGSGDLNGNFTGYESDVVLRARKVHRDNGIYLHFEPMKLAISIGSAKVYLSNLFGGDPILGPVSNEILNANSAVFLDELRPVLETSLSDLFTNVANKITESFTYDELFPKD
ncbi:putative beta-carotene-binding protein isoform X2 [Phymastichus coffea]|uniref:putative beta-carotene-binding protein isoform X2 n=1 Tax=Phymastichus coffea TaxID=108790 RepID=UPI00273C1800|nr:putative beta-carotene-binding protein isoform X2 [Phymastichus coffea]